MFSLVTLILKLSVIAAFGCHNLDNASFFCNNLRCPKTPVVNFFCHHLYHDFFKCDSINHPLRHVCDGIPHCRDSLDEVSQVCSNIKCPKSGFRCSSNAWCLGRSKVCDGVPDCPRGEDETNCENCGMIKEVQMQPLIINGHVASLWPWYAALYIFDDVTYKFFCSGSILNKKFVVTAAHCVWDVAKNQVKVAAGKKFSEFSFEEATTQVTDAEDIFIHPLYQDSLGNYGSDIALIKTKTAFWFSDFVVPICMNWTMRSGHHKQEFTAKVAGMGLTENGTISNELRQTNVHVVPNEDCIENQRYEFRKYVTIGSFCARDGGGVVCNGDSGSGLAVKESGVWTLEGIVSISPKSPNSALCDSQYYTVYTNVGMYVDWIKELINA